MDKDILLNHIGSWIIVIFSVLGLVLSVGFIHEFSHRNDFKNLATDGYSCIFYFPINMTYTDMLMLKGIHHFDYANASDAQVTDIEKNTELKAYGINIVVIIIYFLGIFFIYSWKFKFKKIKEVIDKRYGIREENKGKALPIHNQKDTGKSKNLLPW